MTVRQNSQRLLEHYTNVRDLGDRIERRLAVAEPGSARELRLMRLLTETRQDEALLRRRFLDAERTHG